MIVSFVSTILTLSAYHLNISPYELSKQFLLLFQDEKPPIKKKKVINKKLEALKRKSADDKAKLNNTINEMKKLHWLEIKENAIKRVEKRKSLIQKDEELIRRANEKLGLPTNE